MLAFEGDRDFTLPPADATVAVFDSAGQLRGIGRTGADGRFIRPVKVFVG